MEYVKWGSLKFLSLSSCSTVLGLYRFSANLQQEGLQSARVASLETQRWYSLDLSRGFLYITFLYSTCAVVFISLCQYCIPNISNHPNPCLVLLALYWSVVVDYVSCFPWWPSHSQVSIAASWLQGPIGYDWIPWVSVGQWSPWLLRPPNYSTWTIYYIYILYLGTRMDNFFSSMGFTRNGPFSFGSIALRIWVFDREGLCKSFDSLWKIWKSNVNPKWSRLGVMIGYPNLATNTPIFATKYGCTHKIVVFFQHHVEKKNSNHISTYCPKHCL